MSAKSEIRKALRKEYDRAGDNPPHVNRAWDLIKAQMPDARRSRVREVLKEDEFTQRRHGPGRKATPRPTQPTTAQEDSRSGSKSCSPREDGTDGAVPS
jgi:hypothetical protein